MNDTPAEEARKKAEQEKLTREKMTAFGFDPTNNAELAKFQELEAKRSAGRIEHQDVLRGMETFRTNQDDKARNDEAKALEKGQQRQPGEGGLSKEAARTQFEQSLEKNSNREVEHAAARAAWEKALHGETPAKTLEQEQEQELQKQKDKGRGY
jgi:hypothetical protein